MPQITSTRCVLLALVVAQSMGCSSPAAAPALEQGASSSDEEALSQRPDQLERAEAWLGAKLFDRPLAHSNGRACSTCHVHTDHTTLTPGHVRELLQSDPSNALFARIDADDPNAQIPTFEHVKKGLVRVHIKLADNIDLIDASGNVTTPVDRQVAIWRGVPTVENTSYTAPYQADGRFATFEAQALGAFRDHSQAFGLIDPTRLGLIGDFEDTVFSSARARYVARALESGLTLDELPDPEGSLTLTPQEQRGRTVYAQACNACHGSATTQRIIDRATHDLFYNTIKPDGNLVLTMIDLPVLGPTPVPTPTPQPSNEFMNAGYTFFSYLGQTQPGTGFFNADVALPHYRVRFYADAQRTQKIVDLPPVPQTLSGDPLDPRPALDEHGVPIYGPNFAPQLFSTDPGRALITGAPIDFEAFDMPQLRGIAATAPYFHDNSHETLAQVIDSYSRFILPLTVTLSLPPVNPPEAPGAPPESLSPVQKSDLLAFLQKL